MTETTNHTEQPFTDAQIALIRQIVRDEIKAGMHHISGQVITRIQRGLTAVGEMQTEYTVRRVARLPSERPPDN